MPSDRTTHLLELADDVRDMAQHVIDNGAEPYYASEKLAFAGNGRSRHSPCSARRRNRSFGSRSARSGTAAGRAVMTARSRR